MGGVAKSVEYINKLHETEVLHNLTNKNNDMLVKVVKTKCFVHIKFTQLEISILSSY